MGQKSTEKYYQLLVVFEHLSETNKVTIYLVSLWVLGEADLAQNPIYCLTSERCFCSCHMFVESFLILLLQVFDTS